MANINQIVQQGRFTADGNAKLLQLRGDIDWMEVYNYTVADDDTQTSAVGVKYYWQRGMADGYGWETKKSNAANAAQLETILTSGGFTYIDSSLDPNGASVAITAATNATEPVVSTANTGSLSNGDIVRLSGVTDAESLGGFDFAIDTLVANTSFKFAAAMANAPGAAGTAGNYRKVKFDPLYYPRHRYIFNITQASQAVVTLSVPSGYKVGQQVRFVVPAAYGMTEMDNLLGTITAVTDTLGTQTITVDIDSSAFSAFAFPLPAAVPFSPAMVVPVGMDTAQALSSAVDILSDATDNEGYIAMSLAAGADSPAGTSNDVIYWRAGTSFNVNNE